MTLMQPTCQNQCVCLSQMVTRQGIMERVAKNYQKDNEDPVNINSSNCYRQGDGAPWSRRNHPGWPVMAYEGIVAFKG